MTTFEISIHALREEGDAPSGRNTPDTPNFYPRPPRGGRLEGAVHGIKTKDFYPRPPRGGRQLARRLQGVQQGFLSTPSARRATGDVDRVEATIDISIHALREEGDDLPCSRYLEIQDFYPRPPRGGRLEGAVHGIKTKDFYPRPPRGGRQPRSYDEILNDLFLSTPSARRATLQQRPVLQPLSISIHALREEGDPPSLFNYNHPPIFLSTPSARRATYNAAIVVRLMQFLSTPSARRATRMPA